MIQITPSVAIRESEIDLTFTRSGGPGGQNVNKVASAVQLRFDVAGSPSLPARVRNRLMEIAANRINDEGVLLISASRFRTQERNRQDAVARLIELIRRAAHRPKPRRATRPSKASRQRRIEEKKRRGEQKKARQKIHPSSD